MIHSRNTYTLSLVGNFEPSKFIYGYIDTLADHYHDSGQRLCILLGLLNSNHLLIACHVLELKRIFHDLRLEVVVKKKQWVIQNKGCISHASKVRNQIIKAADKCHIMEETEPKAVTWELLQFFASNADKILYASILERNKDSTRLRYMRRRAEFKYFNPKPYPEPSRVSSARLLARSIDFIRKKRFQILSDQLPGDLLYDWLTDDILAYTNFYLWLDETADLLRRTDPDGQLLPLKVFAFVYTLHNDLWAFGFISPEDAMHHFGQFQTLLHRIAAAREEGLETGNFDVFNFTQYDNALEKTEWITPKTINSQEG